MKKLSILLFAFVALISLGACTSNDDVVFVAQPDATGISFSNTFNESYILTPATAGNIAERFVWNTVNFDVPTNITYELQGSTSEDFSSFDIIGSTGDNNLAIKVSQLMTLAADAGLDADAATEAPNTGMLYFRVKAYAGSDGGNGLSETSEVKSLTVVMPEAEPEGPVLKQFYMVGDATAAGWSNDNNNTPLFRDPTNENVFYYTGRFAGGAEVEGFKLLEMKGAWQPQWGLDAGSFTSSEILGGDPSAFPVTADKYYSLTVNRDELTYSFEAFDASAAATYDVIGIVGAGSSVGWPDDANPTPDIKMTNSDFDKHIWQANNVVLTDGAIKFRANLSWDVNWGGGENFPSGIATGDDIMVKAGTYTVWFNDISKRYIFIPTPTE